ncbi:hypothetical protein [Yinghuangia seranimata]|uniref:hypothetical protein n=1 Tax=Yinghuangia seranimata TaxID=408067 RepID=UPI00248A9397|nr:hypothetical protein [Yinghuangia seranimata]MDI2131086.1 hypothetical protein [Yinghuangia seranimata]
MRDRIRGIGGAIGSAAAGGRDAVSRRVGAGRASVVSGDWARNALGALPVPASPAVATWEYSVGVLVCLHPRIPSATARLLRPLDSLGAVKFGPDGIGFDGEFVPWEKVLGLRVHDAFAAMTTDALDGEVDRVREVLPPVPGRKWAVTKVVEAVATVALASLEQAAEDRLDLIEVPCEITYKGLLGRQKTLRASLFATALLAQQPAVSASLLATARAKGVQVTAAAPITQDDAERVRALRARTDAMAERLRKAQQEAAAVEAGEGADGGELPAGAVPGPGGAGGDNVVADAKP